MTATPAARALLAPENPSVEHQAPVALNSTSVAPGLKVDRYELMYCLATGGMGSIWVARTRGIESCEKLFVLKMLLSEIGQSPRLRAMFFDEARLSLAITHPNVVHVFDLAESNGLLYLVMERLEGGTLTKLLDYLERNGAGRRLPLTVALRIMAQVAAGLHAAHDLKGKDGGSLEVVHRDVAPGNIVVTAGGVAKVIDFGIARARQRVAGNTTTGVRGRVLYMSPEQASGKGVDRRCDIWAVGAVLYELLAGHPLWQGDNDMELLRKLTGDSPLPAIEGLPESVQTILDRTLARDPAGRYATAAELGSALESAVAKLERATTNNINVMGFTNPFLLSCAAAHAQAMAIAEASIATLSAVARFRGANQEAPVLAESQVTRPKARRLWFAIGAITAIALGTWTWSQQSKNGSVPPLVGSDISSRAETLPPPSPNVVARKTSVTSSSKTDIREMARVRDSAASQLKNSSHRNTVPVSAKQQKRAPLDNPY